MYDEKSEDDDDETGSAKDVEEEVVKSWGEENVAVDDDVKITKVEKM